MLALKVPSISSRIYAPPVSVLAPVVFTGNKTRRKKKKKTEQWSAFVYGRGHLALLTLFVFFSFIWKETMCGGRVGLTSLDAVCEMSSVTCVNAHVWYKIKKNGRCFQNPFGWKIWRLVLLLNGHDTSGTQGRITIGLGRAEAEQGGGLWLADWLAICSTKRQSPTTPPS